MDYWLYLLEDNCMGVLYVKRLVGCVLLAPAVGNCMVNVAQMGYQS